MARTKDELRAEAREYIADQLAKGITEIEQPPLLWAWIQETFGDRHTIFSAAGWGWVNKAFADHRELAESLARGLANSAAGRTRDLGDFTQYAEEQV